MTTNTSPADSEPHILPTDDPAEMLAEVRMSLREIPRDCLVLIGHDGHLSRPLITRSDLSHLLDPDQRTLLENHLALMREQGCSAAFALLVVGDGHDAVPAGRLDQVIGRASPMLLDTAADLLPAPFSVDGLWVLADGAARRVVLVGRDPRGVDIAVSPPLVLRPFAETGAAARAVLAGHPVPGQENAAAFRAAGRELHLHHPGPPRPVTVAELFRRAREAVGRLPRTVADAEGEDFMTDCEHIGDLLSGLGHDALHWELLALCADHGRDRPLDREQLLEQLLSDPELAPSSDVCAGGPWYTALEGLRMTAAAARDHHGDRRRERATAAWRGLTAVLVLLAWWNHRYATAGELVDELWEREPDSGLAPLLARMTDTPIPPAWWPSS